MANLDSAMTWVPTMLAVTARLAGMLLVAPVFGHLAVPVKVRVPAAAAMALAVLGRVAAPAAPPATWLELAGGVACELALGAAVGFLARLVFVGVELGAFHVAAQLGLSLGEAIDPLGEDAPSSVRGLFWLLAAVLFLTVGGYRALVGGLLGSFQALPPLASASAGGVLEAAAAMIAAGFVLALKVAAPVLIAMLLATVALGLLHRAVPQCNLLSVELPARVLAGLTVLAAALGALAPLMEAAAAQIGRGVQAAAAAR